MSGFIRLLRRTLFMHVLAVAYCLFPVTAYACYRWRWQSARRWKVNWQWLVYFIGFCFMLCLSGFLVALLLGVYEKDAWAVYLSPTLLPTYGLLVYIFLNFRRLGGVRLTDMAREWRSKHSKQELQDMLDNATGKRKAQWERDAVCREELDEHTKVPHLLITLRSMGAIDINGKDVGGIYQRLDEWLCQNGMISKCCDAAPHDVKEQVVAACPWNGCGLYNALRCCQNRFSVLWPSHTKLLQHDLLCDASYITPPGFFKSRGRHGENNMGRISMDIIGFMTNECGWTLQIVGGSSFGFAGRFREQQLQFKAPHPLNRNAPHLIIELRQAGYIAINGNRTDNRASSLARTGSDSRLITKNVSCAALHMEAIFDTLEDFFISNWRSHRVAADPDYCDMKFKSRAFVSRGWHGGNNMGMLSAELMNVMSEQTGWVPISCTTSVHSNLMEQQLVFRKDTHVKKGQRCVLIELRDQGFVEVNGLAASDPLSDRLDDFFCARSGWNLSSAPESSSYFYGLLKRKTLSGRRYRAPLGTFWVHGATTNLGKRMLELSEWMASEGWRLNTSSTAQLEKFYMPLLQHGGVVTHNVSREMQLVFVEMSAELPKFRDEPLLMVELRALPVMRGGANQVWDSIFWGRRRFIAEWIQRGDFKGVVQITGHSSNHWKTEASRILFDKVREELDTFITECLGGIRTVMTYPLDAEESNSWKPPEPGLHVPVPIFEDPRDGEHFVSDNMFSSDKACDPCIMIGGRDVNIACTIVIVTVIVLASNRLASHLSFFALAFVVNSIAIFFQQKQHRDQYDPCLAIGYFATILFAILLELLLKHVVLPNKMAALSWVCAVFMYVYGCSALYMFRFQLPAPGFGRRIVMKKQQILKEIEVQASTYCDAVYSSDAFRLRRSMAVSCKERCLGSKSAEVPSLDGNYLGDNNLSRYAMLVCDFLVDHAGEWDLVASQGCVSAKWWVVNWFSGTKVGVARREQLLVFRHRTGGRKVFMAASSTLVPIMRPPLQPPMYWKDETGLGTVGQEVLTVSAEEAKMLQSLLDQTYKRVETRDRVDGPLANRFELVSALRSEHPALWDRYTQHRQHLSSIEDFGQYNPPRTIRCSISALLSGDAGEAYFMHGTNPTSAVSILERSFSMALAGKSVGTMFGAGIYLAEASTKADEYAADITPYEGLYAMIVCRAVVGKPKIVEESGDYSKHVLEGPYNTIIGDREKAVGTYREFIFFKDEAIYPEFAIFYRRSTSKRSWAQLRACTWFVGAVQQTKPSNQEQTASPTKNAGGRPVKKWKSPKKHIPCPTHSAEIKESPSSIAMSAHITDTQAEVTSGSASLEAADTDTHSERAHLVEPPKKTSASRKSRKCSRGKWKTRKVSKRQPEEQIRPETLAAASEMQLQSGVGQMVNDRYDQSLLIAATGTDTEGMLGAALPMPVTVGASSAA